jgi:2-keto-4-pentenoate hydratase
VTSKHTALASRLEAAIARRSPLRIDDFPELSQEEAYEVQKSLIRSLCMGGSRRIAGFKISMTSPETQALAGASAPAYGILTSDMILEEPATLSLSGCLEPLLELEIQFIVDEDLTVGAARAEIEAKCSVAPGIEVPDSRFDSWYGNLSVGHIISDDCVAGHVVVGAPMPLSDVRVLRGVRAKLHLEGEVIARGTASSVMGDPIVAMEWLTDALGAQGRALQRSTLVSSGTLCMPVGVRPGRYRAAFTELGEVRLSITA